MNSLAQLLNKTIEQENRHVYDMLSGLGKQIYFPKEGILSQSAEAKAKANKFNATIGTALEGGKPMHLKVIQDTLSAYDPKDIYEYAPPAGKPQLRAAWRKKDAGREPVPGRQKLRQSDRHQRFDTRFEHCGRPVCGQRRQRHYPGQKTGRTTNSHSEFAAERAW